MTVAHKALSSDVISTQHTDSSTELLLVLDWGEKSTILLKNAIEAKKILLLDYLYDIKLDHIEKSNHHIIQYLNNDDLPVVYINGKIISKGKVLSPEDIVNLVLENDADKNTISGDIEFLSMDKKPVFGAAVVL